MKKQLTILFGTLGLLLAFTSNAATVTDDGALTIDTTGATPITTDPAGVPDGFPDGNDIFGSVEGYSNGTLVFNEDRAYNFTYLGNESGDENTFSFTSGDYDEFNTSTSVVGDIITVKPADLLNWIFGGANSPDTNDPSLDIFMVVVGNSVLLGFDDRTANQVAWGHIDQDDLVVAVSVVPVPAAVWLFGTAMLGLFGMRRKSKMEAVAA